MDWQRAKYIYSKNRQAKVVKTSTPSGIYNMIIFGLLMAGIETID